MSTINSDIILHRFWRTMSHFKNKGLSEDPVFINCCNCYFRHSSRKKCFVQWCFSKFKAKRSCALITDFHIHARTDFQNMSLFPHYLWDFSPNIIFLWFYKKYIVMLIYNNKKSRKNMLYHMVLQAKSQQILNNFDTWLPIDRYI